MSLAVDTSCTSWRCGDAHCGTGGSELAFLGPPPMAYYLLSMLFLGTIRMFVSMVVDPGRYLQSGPVVDGS